MNKIKTTILSLLAITAATALTAAGLCAQKSPLPAQAETVALGERLLSPSSYEEYLPLTAPTDAAATDGYVAIADGNTLFVFDRDRNVWQEYTHPNTVTKLQFGSRDVLYFLDGQTNALYTLNAKDLENASPTDTGLVCSTFAIHGDSLYYVNTSAGQTAIYYAPLADLTQKTELYAGRMYSPALSFWNGEIYYVYGTDYLHKLHPETRVSTKVAELPAGVISMTISEGTVLCATETGGFYGYALTDLSQTGSASECAPIAEEEDGYATVSANGNDIYLVCKNNVKKFSLTEGSMTEYLIGAEASALHRLNSASELLLSGNRLFISDDGNDRISVYNTLENRFETPIASDMDTPFMSAYGDTLLTATATQAILYSLNADGYGQRLATLPTDKISGNIVGTAAVYGSYYLVTDTNYCYTLTEGDDGYVWTETLRKTHYAEKLTADASGALYVLNDDAIYRYTEENFLSPNKEGVKLCEDIPANVSKIAVDYGNNLYAMADNTLYVYAQQNEGLYALQSATAFSDALVYGATPYALSFAFGLEEDATYILYEDNYVTVTDGFALPTVKNIPTESVAESIFGEGQAEFSVVQTLPNSLIVEVDGNALNGATVFPYLSYRRSETPVTALKIGETADYAVLSYRENASSAYKTLLIEKSRQTELKEEYELVYGEQKTGFLTNAAKAYKFPSMGLPSIGSFEKNAEIAILGELNGLDCEYYKVAFGESVAYIPKSHVTAFNGAPPATETVTAGVAEPGKRAVWRLTYLVLGAGAICILVDALILRKKED